MMLIFYIVSCRRGKYRSWGLVQRYLLRTSPDAKKMDDSDRLFPYENPKDIEKQMNNNTLAVSQSSTAGRNSSYYFSTTGTPTQQNFFPLPSSSTLTQQSGTDLNKIIDVRINQKLWIIEQTLSRHYLS